MFEQVIPGNTKKFLALLEKNKVRDIAAMKLAAIASGGTKRDFVDLYSICKHGTSLEEELQLYGKKYGNLAAMEIHIQKSLVYFDDAEP